MDVYNLFGEDWIDNMKKKSVTALGNMAQISTETLDKDALIEKIRTDQIVNWFNQGWASGDEILWIAVQNRGFTPITLTVKGEAFEHEGKPYIYVEERGGFISIEPKRILKLKISK